MPTKKTVQRARKKARQGKAPSTQAGEFVREEMEHSKQGRHSTRNPKQAIAIGLSQARRSGVKVAAPKKGKASAATRKKAAQDNSRGQGRVKKAAKKAAKKTVKKATPARKAAAKKRAGRKTAAKRAR